MNTKRLVYRILNQTPEIPTQRPLRIWPGVVSAIILLILRSVLPIVYPERLFASILGELIGCVLILIWWLFLSRSPWSDRLGAIVLMIVAGYAASCFVHISLSGMLFPILLIPTLLIALVAWAFVSRKLSLLARRVAMVSTILLACGVFTLIRSGGSSWGLHQDFAWRWTETAEERMLAETRNEPMPHIPTPPKKEPEKEPVVEKTEPTPVPITQQPHKEQTQTQANDTPVTTTVTEPEENPAEWPGFRGPKRDSIIRGTRIKTDWSASPPVEMWRRPIGPAWSSFAVQDNLIYTQEQRGEEEVVACYNLKTGEPVWRHTDTARFWEATAGAGPRGTPTFNNGRIYAFGATGILNALNANDGTKAWSRNVASDTETKIPTWGFSSSPLVIHDLVIVAAAGQLVAYDRSTGALRWLGPEGGSEYSSPHLATIDGVEQILMLHKPGATSIDPKSGKQLWQFALPAGARIVQPGLTPDGGVVVSEGDSHGLHRINVKNGPNGWTVQKQWNTIGLKPKFSDFVVHKDFAYGFDGSILSCIDLKDGTRKWKGGRYGSGQMLLLSDQDILLVLSEKGELALVKATPDQFTEVAKYPGIKGKTWNHPALVGDILLVRNAEEMATFRLPLANK